MQEEESEYYDLEEKDSSVYPDDQIEFQSKGEESYTHKRPRRAALQVNAARDGAEANIYPTTIEEVDEEANFDEGHLLEGVPHSDDLPARPLSDDQMSFMQQTGIIVPFGEYRARCLFSKEPAYAMR